MQFHKIIKDYEKKYNDELHGAGRKIIVDFNYGESINEFWVRTGSYYALINKSESGSIKVFNNSREDNNLISFESFIKCGQEYNLTEAGGNLTITNQHYYLKAVFEGARFTNESFKITELFFPDQIIILEESTFASDSSCSQHGVRLVMDKNQIPNYLDSEGTCSEPVSIQGYTKVNDGEWVELYGSTGLGVVGDNTSPI